MKRTGLQVSTHLFQKIITTEISKKSMRVGDKDVYDVHLIYSQVLGLQQSRKIDFAEVLALPTSMFKDDGEMRIATTKSDLN